jgi:hypothetical protein
VGNPAAPLAGVLATPVAAAAGPQAGHGPMAGAASPAGLAGSMQWSGTGPGPPAVSPAAVAAAGSSGLHLAGLMHRPLRPSASAGSGDPALQGAAAGVLAAGTPRAADVPRALPPPHAGSMGPPHAVPPHLMHHGLPAMALPGPQGHPAHPLGDASAGGVPSGGPLASGGGTPGAGGAVSAAAAAVGPVPVGPGGPPAVAAPGLVPPAPAPAGLAWLHHLLVSGAAPHVVQVGLLSMLRAGHLDATAAMLAGLTPVHAQQALQLLPYPLQHIVQLAVQQQYHLQQAAAVAQCQSQLQRQLSGCQPQYTQSSTTDNLYPYAAVPAGSGPAAAGGPGGSADNPAAAAAIAATAAAARAAAAAQQGALMGRHPAPGTFPGPAGLPAGQMGLGLVPGLPPPAAPAAAGGAGAAGAAGGAAAAPVNTQVGCFSGCRHHATATLPRIRCLPVLRVRSLTTH